MDPPLQLYKQKTFKIMNLEKKERILLANIFMVTNNRFILRKKSCYFIMTIYLFDNHIYALDQRIEVRILRCRRILSNKKVMRALSMSFVELVQ